MWVIGGVEVGVAGEISIEGGRGVLMGEMLLWLLGGTAGDLWLREGEAMADTGAARRRRNAERPFGGGRPYILICMSCRERG